MAAYLRPRRGTASGSTIVLKEGEIFLDTAKSSSATTLSSWGQIYVGNNSANLNSLKPFVALPKDMVINDGISATGDDSKIANNNSLSTIISAIKNVLSGKLDKTGGTMSGALKFNGAGIELGTTDSSGDDITWKQYGSTGYKRITFGNNVSSNINLTLPSSSGMLATVDWTMTYAVINRPGNLATSILAAMKSSELPVGMSAFNCQNSTDNPAGSGNIATALICKHNLTGIWSYVWVFTGTGQIWYAATSSTLPSSLTWTRKI